MEFEGEDQRALNELVRTLSGRLDLLIDQPPQRPAGGGGGGGGSPSAEDARGPSLGEDVSLRATSKGCGGGVGGISRYQVPTGVSE